MCRKELNLEKKIINDTLFFIFTKENQQYAKNQQNAMFKYIDIYINADKPQFW